jgi:hypothetical protein
LALDYFNIIHTKKRETTVVWNNYNNQIKRILKNKKKMEVGRLKTNEERIS